MNLSDLDKNYIRSQYAGRPALAIKYVYRETGVSMSTAKDFVVNEVFNSQIKTSKTLPTGDIEINVNGRIISIPKALPETLKRTKELVPFLNEMISSAERARDKYIPGDIEANVYCCYNALNSVRVKYVNRYEEKLRKELKIGDWFWFRSFPEYLSKYSVVCESAEKRICNAYKEYVRQSNVGMKIAESEAAKEIRGMRFGVITNSLASALLYTGMSAMTYASQAKKANETYERIMKNYRGTDPDIINKQIMSGEVFSLIYTVSEKICAQFLQDVMEEIDRETPIGYKELSDVHKTHMLVKYDGYVYGDTLALRSALKKLGGIDNSSKNYEKLLDVLQECPYCVEAYTKAINMGIFDIDVFKIARIIGISDLLLPKLQKYVQTYKKNITVSLNAIKVIAFYKNRPVEEIMKQQYSNEINDIKLKYNELEQICDDSSKIGMWIYRNISINMDDVVTIPDDNVQELLYKKITNIVYQDNFDVLATMNLIHIEDIRLKNSTQTILKNVVQEYVEQILPKIIYYLQEARHKKSEYEEAYILFDAEIKRRENNIKEKVEDLNQQGVFAFANKKKLKTEINRLTQELDDYRKKNEPTDIKDAYYKMYSH
jgi:hypothetical protein